ncbi:MAG: hypothetical protein M0R48_01560 [Candidatus Omnitrophica bacterium]|jgi:hypothetical protein|nr:hypothetical protein [Candidatus Omnitrophota bacterium]
MLYYQPTDENSLRHLFACAEEILKISYLGQVPNEYGYDDSPDCLVLDKRNEDRYEIKRCEFKWDLKNGSADFAHNGKFDIAIIWDLPGHIPQEKLESELRENNGCTEIIILKEKQSFYKLNLYPTKIEEIKKQLLIKELDKFREKILGLELATVHAAYIAAKRTKFSLDAVLGYLTKKFPEVEKMAPQGRANVVTALVQMKLIKRLHGRYYQWSGNISPARASAEIEKILRDNFEVEIPNMNGVDFTSLIKKKRRKT